MVGSEVSVKLGANFDAPIMREKTNFVRASDNITLTSWRVTVHSAKSDPVVVRVVEQLPGSWEITKENASHKKLNAAQVEWALRVTAGGQTVLEYTIRTRL